MKINKTRPDLYSLVAIVKVFVLVCYFENKFVRRRIWKDCEFVHLQGNLKGFYFFPLLIWNVRVVVFFNNRQVTNIADDCIFRYFLFDKEKISFTTDFPLKERWQIFVRACLVRVKKHPVPM